MSRLPAIQRTGLAVIVLAVLMTGTSQAAEPVHTLPDKGLLRVGDQLISLYGVSLPAPGQLCEDDDVPWPCGAIAWQVLDQRLLNGKLDCVYVPLLGSSGGITHRECLSRRRTSCATEQPRPVAGGLYSS